MPVSLKVFLAAVAIVDDIGADSLALSWIMADVEDALDFVMRGGELMKLKTFAAFVDYVAQRVGK